MSHGSDGQKLVLRLIGASMGGHTGPSQIRLEQNLYEFGLDSLATVSLVVQLATETGADLEQVIDDLETPRTVADLVALADGFLADQAVDA